MTSLKIEEGSIPDLSGKVALITGMVRKALHTRVHVIGIFH